MRPVARGRENGSRFNGGSRARLAPQEGETHHKFGIALISQGHYDQAVDPFRQAVEIDPQNEEARKRLQAGMKKRPSDGEGNEGEPPKGKIPRGPENPSFQFSKT